MLEIAHLHIGAEYLGADNQSNVAVGEVSLQPFDRGHSGIGRIADAKNDFVFGVVLQAVTAEAFVNFRVSSLQRLENGNRWKRVCLGCGRLARPALEKRRCRPQANEIVNRARHAAGERQEKESSDQGVHHVGAMAQLFVAQRLDRIKCGRFPCRINAKN